MRRVRRKGANKEKVFGCDLLEHLTTSCQEIPMVLRCCSEFVEQNGIVDGIYRLSGVSSNIQKLRSEFEGDGSPDLNKDVYLQDIHCISSLCKAYFRELPNPLLTYQLYDKFAEAVAIQLEEERLVKIRDVLKELPEPHYRTLEFLMRHLVRMASFSSETNMHARNLAIVWAPNLLRSKDIEASGFNGTAAFMEVRVQSIVVEFILTHVPQLFPEQGVSDQRRKSLPSPSVMPNQDEAFFKPVPTPAVANFGNISPGDGPLPIRPYHAIIEGTDKRKGSLKGRKWMSIFNIGGRFQDQRRRHKHSAKEKERPPLRPARSMDSLSTPSYPNEGSRHPAQRQPSTHMSPLVTPVPQSGSDLTASTGAIGGSEYAVTYRRGTGLVSGSAGTQGTYTALDPEGSTPNVTLQSRSPGVSSKAGRRAAMHITGPTLVTVPLHITSNLALGMLQGGGSDRVVHRANNKEIGDRTEGKEEGEKAVKKESRDKKAERDKQIQKESLEDKHTISDDKSDTEGEEKLDDEEGEGAEEEDKTVGGDSQLASEMRVHVSSHTEECPDEDVGDDSDVEDNSDYMVMEGGEKDPNQSALSQQGDDGVFQASELLNSTEMEGYDHVLSGYVQDNFEFLDQMDCSVLDHLDCSVSYQVNEFSVEPPGHSDDEYEIMEPDRASQHSANLHLQPRHESFTQSPTESKPRRPLSLDLHSRHNKSLSLPHMTSPVQGPEDSDSEEESVEDDSEDGNSSSDEGECMFVKSLPSDVLLNTLSRLEPDADKQDGCSPELQETQSQSPDPELSACEEQTTGFGDKTENDELELKDTSKNEDEVQLTNEKESGAPEDDPNTPIDAQSETSPTSLTSCLLLGEEHNEDFVPVSDMKVKEDTDEFEFLHGESTPHGEDTYGAQTDTAVVPFVEPVDLSPPSPVQQDSMERDTEEKEECRVFTESEDTCQQVVLDHKENNEEICEEPIEMSGKTEDDEIHEGRQRENSVERNIWEELEDIVCEVIEDEESEQSKREDIQAAEEEEEEEEMEDEEDKSKREFRVEIEKESSEVNVVTDPEMQQEFVENRAKRSDSVSQEEVSYNTAEIISKQPERENNQKEQTESKLAKQSEAVRSDVKGGRKCETSQSSLEGVGRKLVVSKNPKVYQVKAVPVVPPKPQHCKITALTLRQQQQRERRDIEKGRENAAEVIAAAEQEKSCTGQMSVEEGAEWKDRSTLRAVERERRRDGDRNSPLSMCFDEAVAIATMRREKERREGEGEMEGSGK